MKNIKPIDGGEPFAVHQHIILSNFWEYYLGETNGDGVAFGYVMGFENEWGDVYMPEIESHIISIARGRELEDVMPPFGYKWEESALQDFLEESA